MVQIVDVRGSGGNLVIVGGALTLPTSANSVGTPLAGSLRYNTTTSHLELYASGSWAGLSNAASLSTLPFTYTSGAKPPASTQVLTIPVVSTFTLPTNSTGSVAYAGTVATADTVFTLGYIRGGTPTTIGTITFPATATNGTFATSTYTAQVGDVLTLNAPAQDATLAKIGIVIVATRTG